MIKPLALVILISRAWPSSNIASPCRPTASGHASRRSAGQLESGRDMIALAASGGFMIVYPDEPLNWRRLAHSSA